MVTQAHLETILREVGEEYRVLALHGEASLLVTRRGARILGVFPAPGADNLLWTNPVAFESVAAFKQFTADGGWDIGGERIWLGPQIQFSVRDRNNFPASFHVQADMDPGDFKLWTPRKNRPDEKYMTP